MSIQFSTIIDGVTAKKDRTLSIKLGTQELPAQDTAHIFELRGEQLWCALSLVPLKEDELDIPERLLEASDKSPSQRLRSVLYVLWEQGDKKVDFDTFYRQQMERIIEYIKDKLE